MSLADDKPVGPAWAELVRLLDELRHVETVERDEDDGRERPVPRPISFKRLARWAHAADPANAPAFNTVSKWLSQSQRPSSLEALLAVVAGVRERRTSDRNLPLVLRDATWAAAFEAMDGERRRGERERRRAISSEADAGGEPTPDSQVAVAAGAALPSDVPIDPDLVDQAISAASAQGLDLAAWVDSAIAATQSSPTQVRSSRVLLLVVVLLVGIAGGLGISDLVSGGTDAQATPRSSSSIDPRGLSAVALIPDRSPIADREVGGWPNTDVGHTIPAHEHTPTHGGTR